MITHANTQTKQKHLFTRSFHPKEIKSLNRYDM